MKWEQLHQKICHTLACPPLPSSVVVDACEELSQRIQKGAYEEVLQKAGLLSSIDSAELFAAAKAIRADSLQERLDRELGREDLRIIKRLPLGVLLHIGAGNVKGLGAYSVLEGLLTGNINFLKPSGEDGGVSKFVLKELIEIEPRLKPYVFIFSIPSSNQKALGKLAQLSDGIVVWGGDEAIQAVRSLAGPDKRLIEWGHRFSFTYITREGLKNKEELRELASHLLKTQQKLCSSCQCIFLEEGSPKDLSGKLKEQIQILSEKPDFMQGEIAHNTLRCYTSELREAAHGKDLFQAGGCPIYLLPRTEIIPYLRHLPFALQTAGIICGEREVQELSYLMLRAGAVRVCTPKEMSTFIGGNSHDGEYPLLRYTKIVDSPE
ncbi:MAG: hypothetical protein HFJ10_09925 [Lachnospiraceae bacterium]|jgi:hypothetical protein|nr:hypothetical protein [Lachnospiraceae bacterium]